ncbi:MAG: cellulase family glycosylhydrolase [Planctomycetota bacterium]
MLAIAALWLAPISFTDAQDAPASEHEFSWVSAQGTRFADEDGETVILRGCNTGNWLLLEMWMLAIDHGQFADQHSFEQNLVDRFGPDEAHRLMEVYREHWMTPRDFEMIRSFGFNVIRLPFNYRLLEDDTNPGVLKPDAFKWLDRGIAMAEDAGLYVILDMHGVPGGQSKDHPTGRVDQNLLWEDPVYAERTAWLWGQIAKRYRDRASIAGYDVINEPYGDFGTDVRPKLGPIFNQIYRAIRAEDRRHIVFAPAPLWGGFGFYGNPADNGWTQVAFTEHHYPGLFGDNPEKATHGVFINHVLPAKQRDLEAAGVPMFIGEWNPVFEDWGGGDLMRRYFDEYAARGWAATIWSYKILHQRGGVIDDNWYMVSNAHPLEAPDMETASLDEIERYFRWFAEMEYVVDQPMRYALTRPDPVEITFPKPKPKRTTPPHTDELTGWAATDVGGALAGGQQVADPQTLTVYAGGADIWNDRDEFRFLWQDVEGDFVLHGTVAALERTHTFAKAGLMIRADLAPDAPHVLIHGLPNRDAARGQRDERGGTSTQLDLPFGQWPMHLRLSRKDGVVTAEVSEDGEQWQRLGEPVENPALAGGVKVGLAVLSHDAEGLTKAEFTGVRLQTTAE